MAIDLREDEELKSDINVTPLVDVVLVLLVIFMVVTPLIKQEVPVELPLAESSRQTQNLSQVILTMRADGSLLLNHETVPRQELTARLTAISATRSDKTIFLEADRSLLYDRVVQVMDECRAAGMTTIGLITQKPAASRGGQKKDYGPAGAYS
jgi:biopolymer transport protein ExbD